MNIERVGFEGFVWITVAVEAGDGRDSIVTSWLDSALMKFSFSCLDDTVSTDISVVGVIVDCWLSNA